MSPNDTLDDAIKVQEQTIESLKNLNDELLDTQDVGTVTLETLRRENYKLHNVILPESERLNEAQKTTHRLHNRLGVWACKFGGGGGARAPSSRVSKKGNEPSKKVVTNSSISKAKSNNHHNSHAAVSMDSDVALGLTELIETHAVEVKKVQDNDKVIDTMLDEASTVLTNLSILGSNAAVEVQVSTEGMDDLTRNMDKANYKQQMNNARAARFLGVRSLRPEKDNKSQRMN
jgi:hypothetical protein